MQTNHQRAWLKVWIRAQGKKLPTGISEISELDTAYNPSKKHINIIKSTTY